MPQPLDRWRAVRSDERYAVRQLLLREADAAERDLVHATKRADALEIDRLTKLVEANRAAVAVLDEATVHPTG